MRRIYVAYAKRLATHEVTLQVGLFVLALLVFAKLVHVASVIDNLLRVEVGKLPAYVWATVSQGEVLTLIAIGTMMFIALSIPLRLRTIVLPGRHALPG